MIDERQMGGSPLAGMKAIRLTLDAWPYDDSQPLTQECQDRLRTRVEDLLQKAGVKVMAPKTQEQNREAGQLNVFIVTDHQLVSYSDQIELHMYAVLIQVSIEETVCLCRNPSVRMLGKIWCPASEPVLLRVLQPSVLEEKIKKAVDERIADFVRAYRAANPRMTSPK